MAAVKETFGETDFFAFFHLNLAFSSISEAARDEVITRCYRPLLNLADRVGAIGIEATGYTLEEIHARDPTWIRDLQHLIRAGKVEFIGSGYSQMIGPLVPATVTEKNLMLGGDVYHQFGLYPRIALVNEQAYAAGLVSLYHDAGYEALLMDWDNPSAFHHWTDEIRFSPQRVAGADQKTLGLLWTDTVIFQMLQRLAHRDIEPEAYQAFLTGLRSQTHRTLCLYSGDAEIFDYRPGRYRSEEVFDTAGGSEWNLLTAALCHAAAQPGCHFVLPSALLETLPPEESALRLETPACPVPVKKQRKYNLSRWAVTGRDDTALNAACERICAGLVASGNMATDADWKELCFLWSSDFRTHITDARWQDLKTRLTAMEERFATAPPLPAHPQGEIIQDRHIEIDTSAVHAVLDRRRGLSLDKVSFANGQPLIGKVALGSFADIAWQADWYTGDAVFEAPGEHKITDLEWCKTRCQQLADGVGIYGRIETPKGSIDKHWYIHADTPAIDCEYIFHWDDWGKGALRLGHITLLPGSFDARALRLTTHNGGKTPEIFSLAGENIEHGAPVSFLVSASHGIGMTEGWAELSDGKSFIRVTVDRSVAPLLGLLTHRPLRGGVFCQLMLSALELDDTRRPDALYDGPRRFRFRISGGVV